LLAEILNFQGAKPCLGVGSDYSGAL